MTTMLDRVAEAICQADEQNGGPPWGYVKTLGKHAVAGYYDRARAAIQEMREPTEAMKTADENVNWGYSCHVCGGLTNGWYAMIDKALSE